MGLAASATDALDLDVSAKFCKYKATWTGLAGNGVISIFAVCLLIPSSEGIQVLLSGGVCPTL